MDASMRAVMLSLSLEFTPAPRCNRTFTTSWQRWELNDRSEIATLLKTIQHYSHCTINTVLLEKLIVAAANKSQGMMPYPAAVEIFHIIQPPAESVWS